MFNRFSARPLALALATAALAATAAMPAHAAEPMPTVAVSYHDLDLATQGGQKVLGSRLDRAAREVCGMNNEVTGSRLPSREARACYQDAKAKLAVNLAQAIGNDNRYGG